MAPREPAEPQESPDPFIITSLGLGLGFLFITQSQTLRPLSTAIKLADSAIKIPKALEILHSPYSPQTLIVASKALINGVKLSSRLIPSESRLGRSRILLTRLKGYLGVFNLIRYSKYLELGFVRGGYKISKNFLRVIEGSVGLQLDSAVKKGIDSLGLLLKASAVAREIRKLQKRRNGLKFGSKRVRLRSQIFLRCKRMEFDSVCSFKRLPFREWGENLKGWVYPGA